MVTSFLRYLYLEIVLLLGLARIPGLSLIEAGCPGEYLANCIHRNTKNETRYEKHLLS